MTEPVSASQPRGVLLRHAEMHRFTSWRVGGQADRFYTPVDLTDLSVFLKTLHKDEPVYFIGLGSNLLVRDGGVRGTVIHLHGALRHIELMQRRSQAGNTCQFSDKSTTAAGTGQGGSEPLAAAHSFGVIFAEAGVASPKVARFAALNNLVDAEFLAGIPGTVGGALAMNAGCYGHETWEFVCKVQTVDRCGDIHQRTPKEYRVGYRHVESDSQTACREWFVGAWFMFPQGDGAASRRDIKRLLQKRIASQPLNLPNAGSVFRNPPGDYAARLIEACGLKGETLGGAQVSEKHANFIVNQGNASASDIESLINLVQARVHDKYGIQLQKEICVLGENL